MDIESIIVDLGDGPTAILVEMRTRNNKAIVKIRVCRDLFEYRKLKAVLRAILGTNANYALISVHCDATLIYLPRRQF